jgi:hypothetical protein
MNVNSTSWGIGLGFILAISAGLSVYYLKKKNRKHQEFNLIHEDFVELEGLRASESESSLLPDDEDPDELIRW